MDAGLLAGLTTEYSEPSVRARAIASGARLVAKPLLKAWSRTITAVPWPYGRVDPFAALIPGGRGVERVTVALSNSTAEYTRPLGSAGQRDPVGSGAILYLHGGAWLVGGIRSHRRHVSRLVRETGLPALAVDYRKIPAHALSEGLEDCLDGYRRLLNTGVSAERIAVVGDSAGGGLAVMVALLAPERGLGSPGSLVCISPLLDPDPTAKNAATGGEHDALFSPDSLTAIWDLVRRSEPDWEAVEPDLRRVVKASAAEFAALPPTLVQVGAEEMLRTDAENLVLGIAKAGGQARLELYAGQLHDFQLGADVIPEGRAAMARIRDHLLATIGRPARQ